jgi:hypothetical protein
MTRLCLPVILIVPMIVAACSEAPRPTAEGGVEATGQKGPVRVTVTATPSQLEVGQTLTLHIEAVAQTGVTITQPMVPTNANGTVGIFHVLTDHTRPDIPLPEDSSARSWSQTLQLDTFQAGKASLPAMQIAFKDTRSDLPINGFVAINEITIDVRSLITGADTGRELRDIRGTVTMIDPWPWWVWVALGLGGLVLAGGVTAVMRGRGLQEVDRLSPEQMALRDLATLESSGLLEKRQVQPFYVRLTDILRHYIEGQFGLRAPRSTTGEFLVEMGYSNVLNPPQQQALGHFLRAADMVKFARHEPSADSGRLALSEARHFVEETAPTTGGGTT